MTYREIAEMMRSTGISEWREEAMIISCFASGESSAKLLSEPNMPLPDSATEMARRRIGGEVLQYILGEWDFYGRPFTVREGCLVPRNDTEVLVYEAIGSIPKGAVIADICSGSGCIGVTLLAERRDLSGYAFDLYDTPLALTEENARRYGVSDRLKVVRADVLGDFKLPQDVDCILSNPPYIPTSDIKGLSDDVRKEPLSALDGGEDGLVFYRRLLDIVKDKRILALFEIGYDEGEALCTLSRERGLVCEIVKDISGNNRVARINI